MKISKSKIACLLISTLLVISIYTATNSLPTANAHTPVWKVPTFAYINVAPDPVGVGQEVLVVFWLDKTFDGTVITNDYRFHNYQIYITKPDGTSESKTFDYIVDTTSSQYMSYTPDQVGIYTFNFTFPGQDYNTYSHSASSAYINDTYLPSSAITTLTVQQEPVTKAPNYPLPTEYWTRPIEGENTAWYQIGSNWLGGWGSTITYNVQPDGIAPNTSHIMWTKVLQFGGVVGANNIGVNGSMYYAGESYEERFGNPLIIQGKLYYQLPRSDSTLGGLATTVGGGYVCVDLRTGEQIWKQNYAVYPSFGQLEWFDSPNQHGVIPNGYLWATSGTTWIAYDPIDGEWLFNITGVPSGTRAYGPSGEVLQYQLDTTSKSLALWNITQVITNGAVNGLSFTGYRPVGSVLNSTARDSYSWNVSLSNLVGSGWSIQRVTNDIVLCLQGNLGTFSTQTGANMTAISLNPATRGQILWTKFYSAPANNITRSLGPVDSVSRVFTMADKETMQWSGYSLDTGALLWGPIGDFRGYEYYSSSIASYNAGAYSTAYGNLYVCGFGGVVYCFDDKNGNILWTYGNGGTGNSTNDNGETAWGLRPTFISNIADGKIYLFNNEHSANSPYYKGAQIRCLNATTGQELWTTTAWASGGPTFYSQAGVIADGFLAYFNTYDGQVYSIGKGPSKVTVEAPMAAVELGKSLVIRGTVTDVAAGTKQNEQAARFPNGVPAVSDASQSDWMAYLYMQKPRPTNTTGVPITISVVDSNGNYRDIGTTTSNADGFFTFNWKPDIQGQYTVYASFAGSESYWPSHSITSFAVDPAAPTPEPTSAPLTDVATNANLMTSMAVGVIAIIIAIAVVGLLLLRKRA
jgi:outer membrane protein assembly factor BamB